MRQVFNKIQEKRSRWKFNILKPYLYNSETILDFGCGDLSLARYIARNLKKTIITGVDVIGTSSTESGKNVHRVKYDGKKIPFGDNSFDTVIAFYVLHHCFDLTNAVAECTRVSRKRILIVESIPLSPLEVPFMKFFDWLYNVVKFDNTPLPYRFHTVNQWKKIFKKNKFSSTVVMHPKSYEDYLPFGKLYLLEFNRIISKD